MMIPEVKDQDKFKNIHYYLFDEAPYQDKKYGPNWDEMQELFSKMHIFQKIIFIQRLWKTGKLMIGISENMVV